MSDVEFSTFAPQVGDNFLTAFKRFAKQFDEALNPNPGAWSRKVVIHGSSVAYGVGASSPTTQGWARLLEARLVALGNFTVSNVAVSGTDSIAAVSTFYSKVVVEDPDIVVLGYSLRNDGMNTASTMADRIFVFERFKANILKLAAMCRQLGYDCIVAGVYSADDFTAEVLPFLYQFDRDMEAEGIPYIPFRRMVDDGSGHWQSAYRSDDAHPNTAGHAAMASAIPDALFVRNSLATARLAFQTYQPLLEGHSFPSDSATPAPIKHVWDSAPQKSWTAAVWVKGTGSGMDNKVILALSDGCRVRNPNPSTPRIHLTRPDNTSIAESLVSASDGVWHHVCVTYRASTTTMSLWIDGTLIGSGTYDASAVTFICLAGRADTAATNAPGAQWRHYGFWRGELVESEIIALVRGQIPSSGCEMFCPMRDPEVYEGSHFVNLGTSTGYLLMQQPGGSVPV
jgi:lysophospholipase L1-like esterase